MEQIKNKKFEFLSHEDMMGISGGKVVVRTSVDKIYVDCPPGAKADRCYVTRENYTVYNNKLTKIKDTYSVPD